eukprot:CAMPEP_0181373290 /NCGR_PEP_ID=MMETSP1106-20121128/15290_1 /TAXON_ID=81844 /ORGANISM="Mantoniella antarctica, Strain SL-175" /LENGTH=281 /DNA_ID=CAMNT_0023490959 /DNA_START=54 /DNA_END=899 /DNA_ORIENTATION=+
MSKLGAQAFAPHPVRKTHAPIRRHRRNPHCHITTALATNTDVLSEILGDNVPLGGAVRESEIDSIVATMEGANPTRSPTTSALLAGCWKLRYTTSSGTTGAIAGWQAAAGAVTDVRQRFDTSGDVIHITNIVTVSVPPMPVPLPFTQLFGGASSSASEGLAVRITQRFVAAVQSGSRISTQLSESDIDIVRASDPDVAPGGPAAGLLSFPIQLAAMALSSTLDGGRESVGKDRNAGDVVASVTQPGASFQPAKRQLITYLDDTWRFSRDDTSFSVYSREAE